MRRAYLYTRVSTLDQAREGVSLDAQKARAEAWATLHGYEIAAVYSDPGISGKRADNRPGLQKALTAVCEAKGALVVYSLSRLARSVPDAYAIAGRLQKYGADLVSLSESIDTTSAMGRAFFGFMAVLSQLERELIAERVRMALGHLKSEGKVYGQVPFGKRSDAGELVDDDAERSIRVLMRELRKDGLSWPAIAEALNGGGHRTKKGRAWSGQNARKCCLGVG